MTKFLRLAAILVLAAAIMPLSVSAQEQKPQGPAKAAPAARPAPAARAAPAARPAPAARVAPQRQAPQRAAAPQRAPQRAAAPTRQAAPRTLQHQGPQRTAAPQRATAPTRRATARTVTTPARTATPARNAVPSAATATTTRAQLRSQQRQERTLRAQENRQLRTVPAAQRAQKQQEINQQRQQRAQQRLQPNAQAQPKGLVQPNAQVQRSTRRNGVARVTPQAAQQGRFAARYSGRGQRVNMAGVAPRRAWSRGLRAAFVPWYGPVFWPYAYSDVFDYAFWPSGYDDGYWAYAYDDFVDGVFWGEAGPPPDYGYASAPPNRRVARPSNAAVEELCTQPGTGITAWPFAEINSKVGLNPDQKQLLDQVRSSGQKAAAVFKASCPAANAFAGTPPGRLQAMTLRLGATLEAVQTVRPSLVTFYDSLNDEQKERFNAIGPKQPKDSAEASQASVQDGKSCSEPKAGLTNLPIERIEDVVKPTDTQEDGLKQLEDATAKAVSIMQAACPEDTPITPPGRLEAMEKRLQAMIDAANTVKPALNDFYESLSSEQKARFNRIGGELALPVN
jgi:hypothetical protein